MQAIQYWRDNEILLGTLAFTDLTTEEQVQKTDWGKVIYIPVMLDGLYMDVQDSGVVFGAREKREEYVDCLGLFLLHVIY